VRSRFDGPAACIAFLAPWIFGLLNASGVGTWAGDLAIARTFAESPVGFEGLVSASLSGLVSFVPLGTALTRAGSVAALALGSSGFLLFRLSERLLTSARSPSSLVPAISLLSSLIATVGPSFVEAGTAAGGAAVAAALALAAIERSSSQATARSGLLIGGLLGLTFCESRLTALVAALAVTALFLVRERTFPRALAAWLLAGAGGAALLPIALGVSLLASPGRSVLELFSSSRASLSFSLARTTDAFAHWVQGVGLVWAGVALLGLVVALLDHRARGLASCLLALLVAGALGTADGSPTAPDPLSGVNLLGISALAVAASAGLSFLVGVLGRARLPFARAAGVLLVVYAASLVFVGADDSSRIAQIRESSLAERWTDEAWLSLPPRSLLLVRSEAVYLRLLASRTLAGSRPDVLLVPTAALDQSSVRLDLVEQEAALVPIVRDVLLAGKPSELALTGLADARPMYVELDPNWDFRLYPHLVPHAFFSEFSPHPLGRSDRTAGVESASQHFDEVAAAIRATAGRDPATRQVLGASLSERAILLEALGDRVAAEAATDALLALCPENAIGRSLRARFVKKSRDALDVRALLASR
jgi:hypothetical protein